MKVKIITISNSSKKEFIKEFLNKEQFENYKEICLNTNINYIKYSIFENGYYKPYIKEFSKNRNIDKDVNKSFNKNTLQKNSRNNQLALLGNKLINLNITPSIIRKFNKFMNDKPVSIEEKKIIKSLLINDKISVSQYELLKQIETRVNKRKLISSTIEKI